jgi:8-amino-7-oxononanoate synthase
MSKMSQLEARRLELQHIWQSLTQQLDNKGIKIDAQSHILPVMVGDNHAAMALAQQLQDEGFLVMAVRPPTVPMGTARLRLSLTSSISNESIERFANTLSKHIHQ